MYIKTLRLGSKGKFVKLWQYFLRGQGLYFSSVDGDFGPKTHEATKKFQETPDIKKLKGDGIAGQKTFAKAMMLGFDPVYNNQTDKSGPNWPPKPKMQPLVGTKARQKVFGTFTFKSAPVPNNPEAIEIAGDWAKENIVQVEIPQLEGVKGATTKVYFHKLIAESVKKLFQAWEEAGLMHLVISWGGSYNPRFIRGSRTSLSNHSFGSAFDINVPWNYLGTQPALVGEKGSVRELVQIANKLGFYWGGHFRRKDGMHFEATIEAIKHDT